MAVSMGDVHGGVSSGDGGCRLQRLRRRRAFFFFFFFFSLLDVDGADGGSSPSRPFSLRALHDSGHFFSMKDGFFLHSPLCDQLLQWKLLSLRRAQPAGSAKGDTCLGKGVEHAHRCVRIFLVAVHVPLPAQKRR